METLQPILDLLAAKHGWMAAALGWMSTLRLACKPISVWLQNLLTDLFAFVHATADADDDEFVAAMLKSRWYRALAFIVDTFVSVKLPLTLNLPVQPISINKE